MRKKDRGLDVKDTQETVLQSMRGTSRQKSRAKTEHDTACPQRGSGHRIIMSDAERKQRSSSVEENRVSITFSMAYN